MTAYDLQLFKFKDSEFLKTLCCCICQNVCLNPMEANNSFSGEWRDCEALKPCGHLFCDNCITQWLKIKSQCPLCKQFLTVGQLHLSLTAKRLIEEMDIRCPHQECKWTGCLGKDGIDLKRHLAVSCSHEFVSCCYEDCTERVSARDMSKHVASCPKRDIECILCKQTIPMKNIKFHEINQCSESLVTCPNDCHSSKYYFRKDLSIHQETCSKQIVDCPYKPIGCTFPSCFRHIMDDHAKDSNDVHLDLANKTTHLFWYFVSHKIGCPM